jgi:hypothetical protein
MIPLDVARQAAGPASGEPWGGAGDFLHQIDFQNDLHRVLSTARSVVQHMKSRL